jgi:hypothetical protein
MLRAQWRCLCRCTPAADVHCYLFGSSLLLVFAAMRTSWTAHMLATATIMTLTKTDNYHCQQHCQQQAIVRLTTQLVNPPRLRFWSMFNLIAPPAAAGVLLGLTPIAVLTAALSVLVLGFKHGGAALLQGGDKWILDKIRLSWSDLDADPANYAAARVGRLGLGFVVIGAVCTWQVRVCICDSPYW